MPFRQLCRCRTVAARGRDADPELATLLEIDGDSDMDGLWEDVPKSVLDIPMGSGDDP